jgi:Na+/H+ antiporter NhaD/arsenite permease-like protein
MVLFLFSPWPREGIALAGAGVLLVSRTTASRALFALVDWPLLLLFVGLFVVNAAIQQSGLLSGLLMMARRAGVDLGSATVLFAATAVLSNIVSNVPAVMLLLPAARHDLAGPILALSSTLAGNILLAGSIANIIVVDQARRLGVRIDARTHARVGIPIGLATLTISALWLALRSL